jgi:hypothetical protein
MPFAAKANRNLNFLLFSVLVKSWIASFLFVLNNLPPSPPPFQGVPATIVASSALFFLSPLAKSLNFIQIDLHISEIL